MSDWYGIYRHLPESLKDRWQAGLVKLEVFHVKS